MIPIESSKMKLSKDLKETPKLEKLMDESWQGVGKGT
jgi:hypothetical protein